MVPGVIATRDHGRNADDKVSGRWSMEQDGERDKEAGVIFTGFVLDCWLALTERPCCSGIGQSPCFFYLRAIDERFTGADRIAGPNRMEVVEAPPRGLCAP